MGHSNSAEWVKCLERMEKLEIDLICPGHGKPTRKDLIAKEKRYFTELRAAVKKGIGDKKSVEEITKGLDFPWYKEWTGVGVAETDMNKDNVKHVYAELMGKVDHDRLGARPDAPEWKPEIGLAGR
jgi:glyoxylase-like metal-dependent hydrolase (beta-lactamase superfamily II)